MEDTVPLGKFTTYLGYLVKSSEGHKLNGRPLSKKTLEIASPVTKDILGKYEATLTICSYFTRLNYEWRAKDVLKMYSILDYSPIVFNKAMAYLTSARPTADQLELSPNQKKPCGYLIYDEKEDTMLSICVLNILGEKCLMISFRGTETVKNLMKDLDIRRHPMGNILGKELFSDILEQAEKLSKGRLHPFSAHRGFITGIQNVYPKIIDRMKSLLNEYSSIKRIFLTGHSLGGAYANILGLALAQMKKRDIMKLPDIHLITIGAPKTFTKFARTVFNNLLLDKHLTLDRVTNRGRFPDPTLLTYDVIPLLPFYMKHPGFSTLSHEVKTQSKTGRTIHISELRNELSHMKAKTHLLSKIASYNYNPLPDYPEFFSKFKDSSTLTVDEYSKLLHVTHMTIIRDGKDENESLTQKVNSIVENIFNITGTEFKEAETLSRKITLEVIQDPERNPVTIPKEFIEKMEKEEMLEDIQEGGKRDMEYRKQTVLQQPNQIVYSFPQDTVYLSLLLWHKKYMGVLFGGKEPPNRETVEWRGFNKEAVLYEHDGIWTYTSDIIPERSRTQKAGSRKYNKKYFMTRRKRIKRASLLNPLV